MPKPWRLTRQAEASLVDIANWTLGTFGPRQAAAYEEDLIAVCRDIAAGTAISQDCRRIIDPDLTEDLRFARAGQHFAIFVEDAEQVIIVDFLHARSDLPRRLAARTDEKTIMIDATYLKAHCTASSLRVKKGGANVRLDGPKGSEDQETVRGTVSP